MKNYTSRLALIVFAMTLPLAVWAHEPQAHETSQAVAFEPIAETLSDHLSDIQVTATQKTIHVKNAQGEMLEVFNVTGVRVAALRIDSNEKSVTLNVDKGIYIVRVGNVTRKVKLA